MSMSGTDASGMQTARLMYSMNDGAVASVVHVAAADGRPALELVQVCADVLHGLAAAITAANQQPVHLQKREARNFSIQPAS